jgi:hypothetical protein
MITLQEIAPYLPYGLRIKTKHGIAELTQITTIGKWRYWVTMKNTNRSFLMKQNVVGRGYSRFDIIPIFRPSSDITKEIKINGKKFIPIEEITAIVRYKLSVSINFDGNLVFKGERSYLFGFELKNIYDLLFSWHFWLGDQSRFGRDIIDINTLNK